MELLELMKTRRSIRKYSDKPIEKEKLEKIAEAGLYAPNAGGRQGAKVIVLDNKELIHKIGVYNANAENRNRWTTGVCDEQPSIIDDPSIKSGFYGCSALGIVCVPKSAVDKVNGIGTGFVCAENMVLEAYDLGVSSCIVGRAQATFDNPEVGKYLEEWGFDSDYTPIVFVCLGYIDGEYPKIKARNEGRVLFVK